MVVERRIKRKQFAQNRLDSAHQTSAVMRKRLLASGISACFSWKRYRLAVNARHEPSRGTRRLHGGNALLRLSRLFGAVARILELSLYEQVNSRRREREITSGKAAVRAESLMTYVDRIVSALPFLARLLSWYRYHSVMYKLLELDELAQRDLGISRLDFDSIARGTYRRSRPELETIESSARGRSSSVCVETQKQPSSRSAHGRLCERKR
ncbi:uncharacterized protein YjiS (DUF1127 family) [Bradyrhizobium sp. USDA 4461]